MYKHWTKEEDKILITNYHLEGPAVASKLPGRTVNAVKNRAQQLGLICRQAMIGWSAEEIQILRDFYPIEGKRVLERLPGRSLKTVQSTACRLGIKRQWY